MNKSYDLDNGMTVHEYDAPYSTDKPSSVTYHERDGLILRRIWVLGGILAALGIAGGVAVSSCDIDWHKVSNDLGKMLKDK